MEKPAFPRSYLPSGYLPGPYEQVCHRRAGGIGVTFAAELQRAGRDVALVGRGAQLAALRAGEVRYSRPDGSRQLAVPSAGGPDEIELAPGDVLVLATKAQDVEPVIT
jgi:ketopantoate reductase